MDDMNEMDTSDVNISDIPDIPEYLLPRQRAKAKFCSSIIQ